MVERVEELRDQFRQHVEKLGLLGFEFLPKRTLSVIASETKPACQQSGRQSARNVTPAPAKERGGSAALFGGKAGVYDLDFPVPACQSAGRKPGNDEDLSEFHSLRTEVLECTRCQELARTRTTVVFGSGNPNAELVFVGEAPGYHEDQQGLPFVGRAGELLTRMIEAMGIKREHVFICNVLKCRPPGNRNPVPEEIINCEPYLIRQIEMIKPKVICAMGNFAAQTLLKTPKSISQLRGTVYEYKGIPCVPTFHPAYLLRNPLDKRKAWEDLKKIREILGMKPLP